MGQGPGRRPGRRGRTALGGPRTPPCGLSSRQNPFQYRREAENGPSGLWEPKGGADRGKPEAAGRPRNRPRLRQGQNLRSGCPWAAPGTPESHFPAPEGLKGRLDLERGWKRRPERTPGKPGGRALGQTGGPAPGDLGRAKAAAAGRADPRCPETGRTGPGRGENPRKSEAKRLNYTKTAVTSNVTGIALFRIRAPRVQTLAIFPHPGPRPGTPGDGRRPRRPRREGGRPPGRAPPTPRPPA